MTTTKSGDDVGSPANDLLGFTPYELYTRATDDAVTNALWLGGLLLVVVWWAPVWLARLVVGGMAVIALLDIVSVASVIISTPAVLRTQSSGRDRGFIIGATAVRAVGSAVLIAVVVWAYGRVF